MTTQVTFAPALPGAAAPLGATPGPDGTNFAVASAADGVLLCLFGSDGTETQIPLQERDGEIWHGFLPGVRPGQAYGYRTTGPYDPHRGLRCNPTKLLLDPYARAIDGEVRFGPELLGYAVDDAEAPSTLDSAGHVPRSLVVDPSFSWGDRPRPSHSYADTVIYELHVKGFTAAHPAVPEQLRGTYAGLAHEAAVDHLVDLGVTAVELLPVHQSVPEGFLVERGLTNYWGYNTIGYFAPHAGYSAAARAGRPGEPSSRRWSTPSTAPASRSSSTWSSTTPPREITPARHCATADCITRRTTGWIPTTRGTTSTRRAPATR
jgi:glycogen operon protein